MKVCVLASGSRGNAIWVESSEGAVLFDAGPSCRYITRALETLESDPSRLQALVVSHEHTDHVRGADVLCRRLEVPVFANAGTRRALSSANGRVRIRGFETGKAFSVGDFQIASFSVPHDAAEPVGFIVEHGKTRLGICTDLGATTRLVRQRLKDCNILVLESNHDPAMLLDGPYPWHVKQRIQSRHGHLANSDAAALLDELRHPGLEHVFLAHLSQVNNTPEQALECAAPVLSGTGTSLHITWQDRVSDIIVV